MTQLAIRYDLARLLTRVDAGHVPGILDPASHGKPLASSLLQQAQAADCMLQRHELQNISCRSQAAGDGLLDLSCFVRKGQPVKHRELPCMCRAVKKQE